MTQLAEKLSVLEEETGCPKFPYVQEENRWPKMSPESSASELPKLTTKPIATLKPEGNLRIVGGILILVLIACGTLGFFTYREYNLRQMTLQKLTQVEGERASLQQSVTQLRSDLEQQKGEVEKLAVDLKTANEKAALVESLQETHRQELEKMTKSYEGQIQTLRKTIRLREDTLKSFESRLQAMKKVAGEGPAGAAATIGTSIRPTVSSMARSAADEARGDTTKAARLATDRPAGKVVTVDQAHRFIVIDIGQTQGVQAGENLAVYQDGRLLGEARIERVYQTLSAATVLSSDVIQRVQVGDAVFIALA